MELIFAEQHYILEYFYFLQEDIISLIKILKNPTGHIIVLKKKGLKIDAKKRIHAQRFGRMWRAPSKD
mgnify:CR=1 FL=1